MQLVTKTYPEQRTMVFLNDKDGGIAKFSAQSGHKALAYHKSHGEDAWTTFYNDVGGILFRYGRPLDEFLMVVELGLTPDEKVDVVINPRGMSAAARADMDKEFRASDLFTKGRCKSVIHAP